MNHNRALLISRDPDADPFDRYEAHKVLSTPEPRPPPANEHGLDIRPRAHPTDHQFRRERLLICEAVGEVLGQGLDELRDEARKLRAELVEAKIATGEAKVALLATQMELAEVRRVLIGRGQMPAVSNPVGVGRGLN